MVFLPGKSTMDAIIKLVDDMSRAKDNKESILAIFFDFLKTFELAEHKRLLVKLEKILLRWLTSWIA